MESSTKLPDIRKTRIVEDSIPNVWETVATAEGIALWFVPNDFQPLAGHEFYAEMEPPQGKTACRVASVEPLSRLVYDVGEDWTWTFALKALEGRTELTFIWSGWDRSKASAFGMPHETLHHHLTEGTNVLIKRLARSVRRLSSLRNESQPPEGGSL